MPRQGAGPPLTAAGGTHPFRSTPGYPLQTPARASLRLPEADRPQTPGERTARRWPLPKVAAGAANTLPEDEKAHSKNH